MRGDRGRRDNPPMKLSAAATKRLAVVIGVASVTVTCSAVAYSAAAPAPVNACVKKSGGAVRIVSARTRCTSKETRLTWNKQGPAGARGAVGRTGPQGPPGISGFEIVGKSYPISPGATRSENQFCPAGKQAISGGVWATEGFVRQHGMAVYQGKRFYSGAAYNPTNHDISFEVEAYCVKEG